MQQYRVNYPLLIGLIVGAFVCSGAIFALHHMQNKWQSGWLLEQAEKASADKNNRDAVQYYGQYLAYHPKDEESRVKYFNAYLDLAEPEDASPDDLQGALQVLEGYLRDSTTADSDDMKKIRRRLVSLYGKD